MPFLDLNTDIKPWLGIDVGDTDYDSILTIIRDSIEQAVLNYTEATFALTGPILEVVDASRADQIVPREYPISSVDALYFHCNPDGSNGELIDPISYQVLPDAIILQHLYTPKGRSLVRIDYTYGYDGLPADVKHAMLLAIEADFRRKQSKSMGRNSRSKKDESESFGSGAGYWDQKTGLPKEVVYKLNPYKRYELPSQPIAQRNL